MNKEFTCKTCVHYISISSVVQDAIGTCRLISGYNTEEAYISSGGDRIEAFTVKESFGCLLHDKYLAAKQVREGLIARAIKTK